MYVFVYGTLKRGKGNHGFLENSTYLGEYYTDNNYTLIVSGLPYMVKRTNGGGVQGELYKIDEDTLKDLDLLEGHPNFYRRETIPVYDFESGNMVEAFAYLYPDKFFGDYPWKYEQVRSF